MNCCVLEGKIIGIKSAYSKKGNLYVNFLLKREDQENNDYASIGCIAFGDMAEVLQHFSNDDKLMVRGPLSTSSYVNKNDVRVYNTKIIIKKIGEEARL